MTITALKSAPRKRRVAVWVDGAPAFEIARETVADCGLRAGAELDERHVSDILRRDSLYAPMQKAGRLLETRPRASRELSQGLKQRGFEESVVADTVARLIELGLIDDTQFAAQFIQSRARSHPQALRLSRSELAARGVGRDRVDAAVEAMGEPDELPLARAALGKRVRTLPDDKDARRDAYQRHAAFLARRGFGWDIVRKALAELFDPAETDDIPPE